MFGGTDSYPSLEIRGHDYGAPPPVFTPPPNPYHPTYHSTYVKIKQPAVSSEAKKRGAAAKARAKAKKDALGMHQDGGFPFQLSLTKQNNPTKPFPAVDFSKKKYKQTKQRQILLKIGK